MVMYSLCAETLESLVEKAKSGEHVQEFQEVCAIPFSISLSLSVVCPPPSVVYANMLLVNSTLL